MRFYDRGDIQVPSVTSVLDAIPEEWLVAWKERQSIAAALDQASPTDLTTKAGKERLVKPAQSNAAEVARTIGTWLHSLAEARFKGWVEPLPLIDHLTACMNVLVNFNEFMRSIEPYKLVASESVVHGDMYNNELLHNMPYAGTADAVLDIGGSRYMIDFKTSRKVGDSYIAQAVAYGKAWNDECIAEGRPQDRCTRLMVARLSKSIAGDWETEIPEKDSIILAMELFRSALTVTHIRLGAWGDILENAEFLY